MNGLTATLIVLVIVLIIVAAVAVILGLRAKRAAPKPESRPTDPFHTGDQDSLRGDPRALKAGDIVELRGLTYTVRGTLRLSEGGWSWAEHLLDDAKGTQVWLAVEADPDLVLSLWTPVAEAGEPGSKTIDFAGRTYRSEESGTAQFRSEATTGLAEQGTVRYHDYQASDGSKLGFEAYGDAAWEASTGEELSRYDVLIYPTAD